ncbi:39S ribosomal protein L19, mitochondrial isoform X1 [Amblyraja radiata]|uniref:39S ribosomal protein L19, mitochondrial isoform X1 n=1 Tax=Amblyraja radiata TaxID=386614 RepID=UPI001402F266|nr:39S ribosomal protein L19, mitochondrial isoform X1 [Amblyraja radiata]
MIRGKMAAAAAVGFRARGGGGGGPGLLISSIRCLNSSASDDKSSKFQPPPKPVIIDKTQSTSQRRFVSPEFIMRRGRTNPLKFIMERKDMIQRRKLLNIPEFYVGSILAVTMAEPGDNSKTNRFVGICTQRSGQGLGATLVLRNIIDGQGVEICYDMYSPQIHQIEVLKMEKRLDDNLMYLRDARPEYSTFDFNMKPVPNSAGSEVPVNSLKVKMKPKPWSKRWERPQFNVQGIRFDLCLTEEQMEKAKKFDKPWLKYDMQREYDTSKIKESIERELQKELS